MEETINKMLEIQDDLVGIVITVIITAFVSLITLITNSVIKIILENRKFNIKQQEKMKIFYPQLSVHLTNLKIIMNNLRNNKIYCGVPQLCGQYSELKRNEPKFRDDNKQNVDFIDDFIKNANSWGFTMVQLNDFFKSCVVPSLLWHPILKRKVVDMLLCLRNQSFLVKEYEGGVLSPNLFIVLFNNEKRVLDENRLNKYIEILNKWAKKY